MLHGGGSAGNAWEIGVITGLFDAGLDVTQADLTIGTSAGATAAAQLTSTTPTDLFAAILSAAPPQRTGSVGRGGGGPIGPATNHMEVTSRIIAGAVVASIDANVSMSCALTPHSSAARSRLQASASTRKTSLPDVCAARKSVAT